MTAPSPGVLAFLASRDISSEVVARAGVKSARMYPHKVGQEVDAIAFPALRDGQVVNVKLRSIRGKDFSQTKGGDQTALFRTFKPGEPLVFTEGEMDALAVMESDYHNAVSTPNGAPPVGAKALETKLSFIEANRGMFDAASEIVLARWTRTPRGWPSRSWSRSASASSAASPPAIPRGARMPTTYSTCTDGKPWRNAYGTPSPGRWRA